MKDQTEEWYMQHGSSMPIGCIRASSMDKQETLKQLQHAIAREEQETKVREEMLPARQRKTDEGIVRVKAGGRQPMVLSVFLKMSAALGKSAGTSCKGFAWILRELQLGEMNYYVMAGPSDG